MLDHCFIIHAPDRTTELRAFNTREAMLASLGGNVAELFNDCPKEVLDHLEQRGWHFEGDIGITFPEVDTDALLAVTQPDCVELEEPICMALQPNLSTLISAAKNGDLCLMECHLKSTGEQVAAICAAGGSPEETVFTPFGVMLCGNPYEMLIPPAK